jgi:glycosyltransferase involved in cell wall biosynthesis
MKISVIITIYNRFEHLKLCLQALLLQREHFDEIVISDDGSNDEQTDKIKKYLKQLECPIKYVRQEKQGYRLAAARNNAIQAASGDYIISLDCDILLMPDAIMTHKQNAKEGYFLAGNRALLSEETTKEIMTQQINKRFLEMLWENADKKHLLKEHKKFQRNLILKKIGLTKAHKPKLLGCHFSIWKKDVQKINGFDENYVGWGLEDDDFARRLYRIGLKSLSVILKARALHLWHPAVSSKPISIKESPNYNYFIRDDGKAKS